MARLQINFPDQTEETYAVSGPRVTIGRLPENTIQIIHSSVSAHHAEFVATNGHYRLRDLDSTNHCFVGGKAVAEFHLRDACEIKIGSVVCHFEPSSDTSLADTSLSPAELIQEISFLRAENTELREKNRALARQIDIVASARVFTERRDSDRGTPSDGMLKALTLERDELLEKVATLGEELEHSREDLEVAVRARDAARQASGLLHSEKASILRTMRNSAAPLAQTS